MKKDEILVKKKHIEPTLQIIGNKLLKQFSTIADWVNLHHHARLYIMH